MITSDNDYSKRCFQVKDLNGAVLLSEIGILGIETVNKIHDCLASPEKFASLCNTFPDIGFECAGNLINGLVADIVASPSLLKKFILNFRAIAESARYTAACFLESAFNEVIESSPDISPVIKAEWFCINLEIANHTGGVSLSDKWAKKAREVIPDAVKHPEGRIYFSALHNYEFVYRRHNQYHFYPDMPDEFTRLIEKLEKHFAQISSEFEGASDPVLGSIFGTIAQNYGFCGPDFLDKSIHYSKKAITTFGGNHAASLSGQTGQNKDDCLRQYNYMTYAYLDAVNFSDAEKHLLLYLEKDSLEDAVLAMASFSEWEHAMFTRFIADTENRDLFHSYLIFCEINGYRFVSDKHPWQLWFYNMARCAEKAGRKALIKNFASKSIRICGLNHSGSTMNVMALLPLSMLYAQNMIDKNVLINTYDHVAETAFSLNPSFFSSLKNDTLENNLTSITKKAGIFFPFSYR
jgi:hypothetical protein